MPTKWKSLRDVTVRTTKGHVVSLEAGVPKTLPDEISDELMLAGCIPVGEDREVEDPAPEFDRGEAIRTAIEQIVEADDDDAFTGDGVPRVNVVSSFAGVKVSKDEVIAAWERFQEEEGEEEE